MSIVTLGKVMARNGLRPRFLRSVARGARQWDWSQRSCRLKRISRQDLLGVEVEVTLSATPGVFGETPVDDLMIICALARLKSPRRIFEFGTFTGNTTLNLAMNAPHDAAIVTLDLSPQDRAVMDGTRWETTFGADVIGRRFRDSVHAGRVSQLLMDSRKFDPGPYAHSIDFAFIDACHEYQLVKNDSEKAFEMLAPGGVVAWHDYTPEFPGVCRHLEEVGQGRKLRWIEGTSVVFYADDRAA